MPVRRYETDGSNASDKRYLPRWEVKNRVLYQLDNDHTTLEGQTKDLSCMGACFLADRTFSPDQNIKLTIYLSRGTYIHLSGKIIWCRPTDGRYEIGVSFPEIPEDDRELILQYAFEIKKEDVIQHWFKDWDGQR